MVARLLRYARARPRASTSRLRTRHQAAHRRADPALAMGGRRVKCWTSASSFPLQWRRRVNSARTVALIAMSALVVSCGDDDNPATPDPTQNNLVFTREDQSQISFSSDAQLYVWCGPWQEGEVDTESIQVFFGVLAQPEAGWHRRAVVAGVTLGEPLPFPNDSVWDQPNHVSIFVLDPPNELSTHEPESSGSIVFQRLDCGSDGDVEFTIDAVIGSEFGDSTPVHVAGTFRA